MGFLLAAGVGVASFGLLGAWTAATFDGTARSVVLPLVVMGAVAGSGAGVLTWRLQGRWWPGPAVVAVAWFAQWQYLLWKSLMVHG